MGPGSQSRARHRRLFLHSGMDGWRWGRLHRSAGQCLTGTLAQAGWYLALYLKLLLLPGLLSSFLLSRGNLSPPMSNIFSASWKKGGASSGPKETPIPKFQRTEHVSRTSSSWTIQGLLKAHRQRFQEHLSPEEAVSSGYTCGC